MGSILRAFLSIGQGTLLPPSGINRKTAVPYLAHSSSNRAPTGERQDFFYKVRHIAGYGTWDDIDETWSGQDSKDSNSAQTSCN
jgi:hypothetical protein